MALSPGTCLGPYEISGALGAGAMGEVYRARDTKLGREVALKLLPEAFARDRDRLARFEREARLLASLNHPNIAQIYDMTSGMLSAGRPEEGTRDVTVQALVLELVEGQTLKELIAGALGLQPPGASAGAQDPGLRVQHGLSLDEALTIASQIASALETAHDKGIVHRDLKPANIKITPEGIVKVLDFGLGRVTRPSEDSASGQDPTITADATLPGAVIGTAAYMSPEQARGRMVDRRTDIWAFGCVLYEMLTGTRPFGGATISDTIACLITRDPDWTALPVGTPPAVRRLLQRCLQKDARRRLRDIGDARLELDEAGQAPGNEPDARAALASTVRTRDVRLERLTDSVGMAGSPAVSPDGKMVAFVASAGGRRQIWVRLLAGGVPLQITRDNVDHEAPRWLPDSSALIYYAPTAGAFNGNLWRVSALGGPPRRVAPAIAGGDVSHDGRRLALFQRGGDSLALVVMGLDGSAVRSVLTLPSEFAYQCPRWSPDDQLLTLQYAGVSFDTRIDVVPAAGGERLTLARAGWMRGHAWLPDGSGLVYSASTGSTMAYPPTNNLRIVNHDGSNDRQLTFGDTSYYDPDVDTAGRLVASRVRTRSDVWQFPIDGEPADNVQHARRITRQTGTIQAPSVSPDGRAIVYVSDNGGHSNLWLAALDGSSLEQITFERDPAVTVAVPIWAPTGDRLLFVRAHDGRIDVCLINSDGSGFRTLLADAYAPCWSGDGQSVYCSRETRGLDRLDLATGATVTVRADDAMAPMVPREGGALYFVRLPDARLVASGDSEVCRAAPEDGPAEVLAKVASARVPLAPRLVLHTSISPDGRWLATPLLDGPTTNIWLIPTSGGPMRPVTDFGERSVFIARWISWSPDSRHVFAAVADTDADIILLDGLLG